MRALRQKLIRDLKGSLGILGTVVAIIGVGTGSLIGLASAQRVPGGRHCGRILVRIR